jgi:hypothetical protein
VSHPIWPDEPTLRDEPIIHQAAGLMSTYYLSRGFMESPEWEHIGADERYGWIGLARALVRLGGEEESRGS